MVGVSSKLQKKEEVKNMLSLSSILIFSEDPKKLSDFYSDVLQKEPDWDNDNGYYGFMAGQGMITIGPHDKVKGKNANPERVMINFETDDVEEEFKRIKDLEATVIAKPYQPSQDGEMWIATFADPDGNYFQLMTPMVDMRN
jgi:predicted enzyme related to lactoylglutathione lyase